MKLKSAVFVNKITATFTQLKTVSANAVTFNRIVSEAEVGNFVYFARYFDTYYIRDGARPSDQLTFSFFKEFAGVDTTAVVEVHFKDISKGLSETVNIVDSEQILKDFNRPVDDAYTVSDLPSKGVAKAPFLETTSVADTLESFEFGKNPFDTSFVSESLRKDMTRFVGDDTDQEYVTDGYFFEDYIVGEPTEILALTDLFAPMVSKPFADSGSASDVFTRQVNFSRSIDDSVYFTDDVDGEASILDDQEMQFFKNTTNTASVAESFDRVVAYIRAFSDSSAASDQQTNSVGKGLSETSAVAESTNVLTSKHIYDIPVASELLSKAFSRPRSDSALIGDANTVALDKLLQDLASTTDAGSLRSQGYSDFTYFEEDFVGASRTF